ncbi:MAG: hypothetical protein IJX25_04100, partial [Clostridia bacterium]|nr:hypothetical protein [Clostridia bacterium]
MADEKKSKGRGKKILIGALILALIVAVVVILVVALPKGKTAQENLNAISSISMADNEDTKADYQAFSTKIGSTAGVQYYSDEVASVLELTVVVDKVVDFYNEYAPLCERIKNERAINDALSNIKASQKQLSSILVSAKAETTEGYTHIQNVWINYRSEFTYQLNQYQTLLNCLNKTYHTCLGQTMVVNEA